MSAMSCDNQSTQGLASLGLEAAGINLITTMEDS